MNYSTKSPATVQNRTAVIFCVDQGTGLGTGCSLVAEGEKARTASRKPKPSHEASAKFSDVSTNASASETADAQHCRELPGAGPIDCSDFDILNYDADVNWNSDNRPATYRLTYDRACELDSQVGENKISSSVLRSEFTNTTYENHDSEANTHHRPARSHVQTSLRQRSCDSIFQTR